MKTNTAALSLDSFKTQNSFGLLTREEQLKIVGGDLVSDLLANVFSSTLIPQNSTLYQQFVTNLTELASTAVGNDMLTQLYNMCILTGQTINLSPDSPSYAVAYYDRNHKTLSIGNFSDLYDKQASFGVEAHELFHAYQDIVKFHTSADFHENKSELEATLFARMAEVEYDVDNSIAYGSSNSHVYHSYEEMCIGDNFMGTPSTGQTNFKTAWLDILTNHNFTLSNYNAMIDAFAQGGTTYDPYNTSGLNSDEVTSLTNSDILQFFQNDYYSLGPSTPVHVYTLNTQMPNNNPSGGGSDLGGNFGSGGWAAIWSGWGGWSSADGDGGGGGGSTSGGGCPELPVFDEYGNWTGEVTKDTNCDQNAI